MSVPIYNQPCRGLNGTWGVCVLLHATFLGVGGGGGGGGTKLIYIYYSFFVGENTSPPLSSIQIPRSYNDCQ